MHSNRRDNGIEVVNFECNCQGFIGKNSSGQSNCSEPCSSSRLKDVKPALQYCTFHHNIGSTSAGCCSIGVNLSKMKSHIVFTCSRDGNLIEIRARSVAPEHASTAVEGIIISSKNWLCGLDGKRVRFCRLVVIIGFPLIALTVGECTTSAIDQSYYL